MPVGFYDRRVFGTVNLAAGYYALDSTRSPLPLPPTAGWGEEMDEREILWAEIKTVSYDNKVNINTNNRNDNNNYNNEYAKKPIYNTIFLTTQ